MVDFNNPFDPALQEFRNKIITYVRDYVFNQDNY